MGWSSGNKTNIDKSICKQLIQKCVRFTLCSHMAISFNNDNYLVSNPLYLSLTRYFKAERFVLDLRDLHKHVPKKLTGAR